MRRRLIVDHNYREDTEMPRPPLLPTIDWPSVFAEGKNFDEWIAACDFEDRGPKMKADAESFELTNAERAALAGISRPVHVVAIAEDWCGDVVRHAPVLGALAAACGKIRLSFIAREPRLDVFARFLTNGGEAIPKFIFLSEAFVETGNWGPMPALERGVIAQGKASGQGGRAREIVNELYAADAGRRRVVEELIALVEVAASVEPISPR